MRLARAANALLGLGAFAIAGPAHGGGLPSLDQELAAIANDAARPLASLSALAIRDGKVVYEGQFGRRFIDGSDASRDKPATRETLYRIASISKLVTTLGVMRLVEEGRLALDADVGSYLGYRLRNPHFPDAPITLRMLLSHTSSLRDDAGYFWPAADIRDVLLPGGRLHGSGAMWSPRAKPGAYFSYANLPWGVVGTVVEKATGERFDRLMKRLVIDPLKLSGGYNPAELPEGRLAHLATLYRKARAGDTQAWDPKGPWVPQVDDPSREAPVSRAASDYAIGSNGTLFAPQGGLRASAADLGRIMLMLMNGGELEGKRFLHDATIEAMLSRQWRYDATNGTNDYGTARGAFNAWGLGNQHFLDIGGPGTGDRLVAGGGFTAVGHSGDAYGLNAVFAFDPRTKHGVVFLTGGPGFDPATDRGAYSSFHGHVERILTALHRRALGGPAN